MEQQLKFQIKVKEDEIIEIKKLLNHEKDYNDEIKSLYEYQLEINDKLNYKISELKNKINE